MMRSATILLLLALAAVIGGCSKCGPPYSSPRACHADMPSVQ